MSLISNILLGILKIIFVPLAVLKGRMIRKQLETDPEMIAAKKQIDEATERMKIKAKEIEESTGIKLIVK